MRFAQICLFAVVAVLAQGASLGADNGSTFPHDALGGEAFGIRMGTPIADLDIGAPSASADPTIRVYGLKSVPKPRPTFDFYLVKAGDKAGVCSVEATAHLKNVDRADETERALLSDLEKMLGPPQTKQYPVTSSMIDWWTKALDHLDPGDYPKTFGQHVWRQPDPLTRQITLDRPPPLPVTLAGQAPFLQHEVDLEIQFKTFDDCIKESQELHRRR